MRVRPSEATWSRQGDGNRTSGRRHPRLGCRCRFSTSSLREHFAVKPKPGGLKSLDRPPQAVPAGIPLLGLSRSRQKSPECHGEEQCAASRSSLLIAAIEPDASSKTVVLCVAIAIAGRSSAPSPGCRTSDDWSCVGIAARRASSPSFTSLASSSRCGSYETASND